MKTLLWRARPALKVEGESAERIRSFVMENPAVSLDEAHEELAEESLIEEVSIDGMCGVY